MPPKKLRGGYKRYIFDEHADVPERSSRLYSLEQVGSQCTTPKRRRNNAGDGDENENLALPAGPADDLRIHPEELELNQDLVVNQQEFNIRALEGDQQDHLVTVEQSESDGSDQTQVQDGSNTLDTTSENSDESSAHSRAQQCSQDDYVRPALKNTSSSESDDLDNHPTDDETSEQICSVQVLQDQNCSVQRNAPRPDWREIRENVQQVDEVVEPQQEHYEAFGMVLNAHEWEENADLSDDSSDSSVDENCQECDNGDAVGDEDVEEPDQRSSDESGSGSEIQHPVHLLSSSHKILKERLKTEKFTSAISTPVNASPAEAVLMTLKFSQQNNLSFKAFVDSVKLINSIFLSPVIPNSAYTLDSLLHSYESIMRFFYCENCSYTFGQVNNKITKELQCPECKMISSIGDSTKASHFVLYPVEQQVELLLKNKEIREKLRDPEVLVAMSEPGVMKDLYDGKCYKRFVASLGDTGCDIIITFTMCTDGSPLFKSSNFSIWPFFLCINELPPAMRMKNLIIGGLWFGNKKPHMDLFLKAIADHLRKLAAGFKIHVNEGEELSVKAYPVACCVDSGARGAVQGLNTHSGYYACNWCEIPGEYFEHKVVFPFPSVPPKKRSHDDVLRYAEECVQNVRLAYVYGVQYLSPLATLPKFDIVDGMVQDYAHNVPFGISRTFLNEWLSNTSRGYYIGAPDDVEELNKNMMNLKPPLEVRRPVRKISDRSHFNAREFENWTLYYSLIVLSGILPKKYLTHWSYLVQGFFLLSRQRVTYEDINNARMLLLLYERDTEHLYGKDYMSYNMHILGHHLAENTVRWGPTFAVSTFCFESGIKDLKSIIHAQHGVPHQIHRAFAYRQAFQILNSTCCTPKTECYAAMIVSKPNKKTCYLPLPECVVIGAASNFHPTAEEDFLLRNSGVNIDVSKSSVYHKIIAGSCVFTTEDFSAGKRFNNSCAMTTDNKVILIKKFLCDKNSEKVYLFYVEAVLETFLKWPPTVSVAHSDHCLRAVRCFTQRLRMSSVQKLKIVCVLSKVDDKMYVGEFANLHNVF